MTRPSPSDGYNEKSYPIDTVYQENLRESFAYYSDKWDNLNSSHAYQIRKQWLLNNIHEFYQTTKKPNFKPKLLDAGCGNGLYLIDLVETLGNIDGIGVDLTEEMVAAARKRALHLKGNYEWIHIDLENDDYQAKLGERQFDIIMMNGVVSYFRNIPKVLNALKNLLRQEGKLIIVQHDPKNFTNLVMRIKSFLEPEFIWVINPVKQEVITYAETAGYSLQESQVLPCGGLPDLLYNVGQIFWDGYGLVFTHK